MQPYPVSYNRRFIPAHAGNSARREIRVRPCAVHPRACGEQTPLDSSQSHGSGSSPRMRGTGRAGRGRDEKARFIPAHAGNSRKSSLMETLNPVHPRACGEQFTSPPSSRDKNGSSPRMRGTVGDVKRPPDRPRFIPAHAGNRPLPRAGYPQIPVHPRACGEQLPATARYDHGLGSSPRMRGTAGWDWHGWLALRFIPAHAGNSSASGCGESDRSVHPRACGEQLQKHTVHKQDRGSSPRMRGTGTGKGRAWFRPRFIPAHAGNRSAGHESRSARPVHPRACGEQFLRTT